MSEQKEDEREDEEPMPTCACPHKQQGVVHENWRFCTSHQIFWCVLCDGKWCPACEHDDIEYDRMSW